MQMHMQLKRRRCHFYVEVAHFSKLVRIAEPWCQNERGVRPGSGTQRFALCPLVFHHHQDFLLQVRHLNQTRFCQSRMDHAKKEIGSNRVAVLGFQNVQTNTTHGTCLTRYATVKPAYKC